MSSEHVTHDKTERAAPVDGVKLTPEECGRRRMRNIAIGVALCALFILFYVLTIARLGANVFSRPF